MFQTLEVIHGGGGSIRVGTTGTISSLMTRELESMKCTQKRPISSRRKPQTVSVSCGVSTPKRLHPRRTSSNETSSSGSSSSNINHRNLGSTQKTRCNVWKNTHRIPMLSSDDISVERTRNREKPNKKGSYIVEVVDLKCGNRDKWSSPIANRLKKLSFSKLSETVG